MIDWNEFERIPAPSQWDRIVAAASVGHDTDDDRDVVEKRLSRRSVGSLVALGCVALLIVGLTVFGSPASDAPSSPASSSAPDGLATETSIAETPTSEMSIVEESIGSTPTTVPSSTSPMPSEAPASTERIIRPVFPADVCVTTAVEPGPTVSGSTAEQPVLFAKSSDFDVSMQVFADPDLGAAGPVALFMRFRDRNDRLSGPDVTPIANDDSGLQVRLTDQGVGEAAWTAPDGSMGYMRSRNLDFGGIVKTVLLSTPRDLDHPVPGFDFFSNADSEIVTNINGVLELVEETTASALEWPTEGAASTCHVESTDLRYRVSVRSGSIAYQAWRVLDQPAPLEVGWVGGRLAILSGVADPVAPTLADLENAQPEEWDALIGAD